MKVYIFTKEDGPEMREAKEFGANLTTEGYDVEYYDCDEELSTPKIEIYDIYSYPTFVIAREDGSEIECWRGTVPIAGDFKNFLNQ
jgi:hypothetical protein